MKPIVNVNFVMKYIKYFERLLSHYDKEKGDIFTFLINSIKEDFDSTIERIKSSIEFMSFYYALRNLEKRKGLIKKEEIISEIEAYCEKLKKYVESFNFPNEVIFSCVFDINDIKSNKLIRERAPIVLESPENFRKYFGAETRNYLSGTIIKIIEKIDQIGIFNSYVEINNKSAKRNNLSVLMIKEGENEDFLKTIMEDNKDFFPTTAKEIFYTSWLDKQSLETLIYMNLFWANKFAKSIEDIYNLLLLLSKRKTLLHGIKNDEVNFDTLMFWFGEEALSKRNINDLLYSIKDVYGMTKDQIDNEENKFVKDFFLEDIYSLSPIYADVAVCYTLKKMSIFYALEILQTDREVKNYGMTTPTNDNISVMVAFMIDVPGYNLPISFHIEKKSLYIFYTEFCKKDKIRKYIGVEDFYDENKKWGNSFLYPLTKSQREYIHKVKDLNKTYAHLDFLQRRIWPKHMKDDKGKPIKEFIDVKKLT